MVRMGLDPSDFEWHKVTSQNLTSPTLSILLHKPSGFFFRFDYSHDARGERRESVYAPGTDNREERNYPASWDQQVRDDVVPWLENLRDELAEPDLWSSIAAGRLSPELLRLSAATPDAPFSDENRVEVRQRLEELEQRIADLRVLSKDQFESLHRRLDEIAKATQDLSRHRWVSFAVGEMAHYAVEAGAKSPWVGKIFSMAFSAFHNILKFAPTVATARNMTTHAQVKLLRRFISPACFSSLLTSASIPVILKASVPICNAASTSTVDGTRCRSASAGSLASRLPSVFLVT